MKSLVDCVKESQVNESLNKYEIDSCHAVGNMKYGFMCYDDMSGVVTIIQFNKLSEYCDFNGFEEDDMMGIDKLKVGHSVYDGASYMYTRIW